MDTGARVLAVGIDGHWTAMDFARLLHIVVRHYRLEQLVHLAQSGGPNLFQTRLDAVALKHLAAFDWIAAPLMSRRYNESYVRSEELVSDLGLSDLSVVTIRYGSPGEVAFAGLGPIIETMHETYEQVLAFQEPGSADADDGQGRLAGLEAVYAANVKEKASFMRDAEYSEAELHAIVSPSIEDLHFLSNAATLGKIVAVEKRATTR